MLSDFASVVTAIATSIGTGILVYQLYQRILAGSRRIIVKPVKYYHQKNSGFASVSLSFSSKEREYIYSIECVGRKIGTKCEEPSAKKIKYDLSVLPEKQGAIYYLYISPPPSGEEPIIFKFDVGGKLCQREIFHYADFSVSHGPGECVWPTSV